MNKGIRFAKGAFRVGRKPRCKEQPLTATQADRVKQLVASLTTKPTPKPAAAVKPKPVAVHKAKPSTGRAIVGRELDNLLDQAISEFCSAGRHGAFLPGSAVRSLVR